MISARHPKRDVRVNRNLISFLLFVVSSSGAICQPVKSFGIMGGITSATWIWKVDGLDTQRSDRRLGLDAGAFVEWLDMPVFSLLTEVHYVQKGREWRVPVTTEQAPDGTGAFVGDDIRLDYLSISILPKIRFETAIADVYAIAGIRADISLSDRIAVEGSEAYAAYIAQGYQSMLDRFKSFQLGGTLGVGTQVNSLFPFAAGIEFRYSPDFQSAYSVGKSDITNTSFELLLRISI